MNVCRNIVFGCLNASIHHIEWRSVLCRHAEVFGRLNKEELKDKLEQDHDW